MHTTLYIKRVLSSEKVWSKTPPAVAKSEIFAGTFYLTNGAAEDTQQSGTPTSYATGEKSRTPTVHDVLKNWLFRKDQ